MSKNESKLSAKLTLLPPINTKSVVYSAVFAALAVILSRFLGFHVGETMRISIEAVPMVLAGIFFGPVPGMLVGFIADFIGCMFSPFGYNPMLCMPPILYGMFGGLMRPVLAKKVNLWTLFLTMLLPVLLGSVLLQSYLMGQIYGKGFWYFFSTRSIEYSIKLVVEVIILQLLFKTKVFHRVGLWPLRK